MRVAQQVRGPRAVWIFSQRFDVQFNIRLVGQAFGENGDLMFIQIRNNWERNVTVLVRNGFEIFSSRW